MRARSLTVVPLCLLALALLAGCGEKNEDLSPPATTPTTTVPGAKTIPVPREVAVVTARNAASAAVPEGFTVKPDDWTVSCEGGATGGAWSCRLKSTHCAVSVKVPPYQAKAEEAAGQAPSPQASEMSCARRSAPAK